MKNNNKILKKEAPDPSEVWKDRVWMNHANGTRILNPVMVANIMELASLDGDVPEFRVGRIPTGGSPAVPVDTESLNSVEIGMCLKVASETVGHMLEAKYKLLTEDAESGGSLIGVDGYYPGQKAAMVRVGGVGTSDLIRVGEEEKRKSIHRTISTSQGRISASASIERNLVRVLRAQGLSVELGDPDPDGETSMDWSMECHGSGDVNPEWDPVFSAFTKMYATAKSLCNGAGTLRIKVDPISELQNRRFGWKMRVGVAKA
jgi:hypothetical protein